MIHHELGRVVAMIEVVSPGNKDSKHAVASFIAKAVDFIRNGIHFLVIDLFPPGPRDPQGIAQAIWDELVGESLGTRPADKLLTVAAYDAGNELTAYVDALAVGDLLPDAPLFLAPGWYVNVPLEQTYMASWDVAPKPIRDLVAPPRTAGSSRECPRARVSARIAAECVRSIEFLELAYRDKSLGLSFTPKHVAATAASAGTITGSACSNSSTCLRLADRIARIVSIEPAVVGCVCAPHEPAVVVRVAGLETNQAARIGPNVDSPVGDGRLENDGLANRDAPEFCARI